jgi:sortase (surface protein transpeptidase)
VALPVQPVGVGESGAMALPARPDVAGWYRFGPAPGAPRGTAVLAGHVDSRRYGLGPLVALQRLRAGAEVRVRLDTGRTLRYEVTRVETVPKTRLDLRAVFRRDGAPRLVLITCGGTFDRAAGRYESNVVVTAVPADP